MSELRRRACNLMRGAYVVRCAASARGHASAGSSGSELEHVKFTDSPNACHLGVESTWSSNEFGSGRRAGGEARAWARVAGMPSRLLATPLHEFTFIDTFARTSSRSPSRLGPDWGYAP